MRPALRLIPSGSDSENYAKGAAAPKPTNGAHRKSTILVVEDEVLLRAVTSEFLRDSNYRVLEASTAEEAKSLIMGGEPIELVFSDVHMPGKMNGFELASWVKQTHPDVKVLLTSGVARIAHEQGYASADGPLLQKPYLQEILLVHIKRMLLD